MFFACAEYPASFWDPTPLRTCKAQELPGWLATVSCRFLSPLPSIAFLVPLPPLQQSIHPLLQPSSLWWVSCHCLSLQLWTQLPEPDGPISTSSSLSHGVYKGASEPEATADWPWSVEISLSQNNMPREVEKNCLQCNSQRGTTQTDNVAFIVLECKYVFSTWLRFD